MTFPITLAAQRDLTRQQLIHTEYRTFVIQILEKLRQDIMDQVVSLNDGRKVELSYSQPIEAGNPMSFSRTFYLEAYVFLEDPETAHVGEAARKPHFTWKAQQPIKDLGYKRLA